MALPWRVLLVEDNPDHAELIIAALEDVAPDCRVDHVLDGDAAVEYLGRQRHLAADPSNPLLVLLDLRLPKRDGIEVLREIKNDADLRTIPIVVLTTSDAEGDIRLALANHANSYVVKPLGFEALRGTVRRILAYWTQCNRAAC